MNFETHYLNHCRVIPLQSFGSHIRSQPHGLGLTFLFRAASCAVVVDKLQLEISLHILELELYMIRHLYLYIYN
jgi:hypothetical protein